MILHPYLIEAGIFSSLIAKPQGRSLRKRTLLPARDIHGQISVGTICPSEQMVLLAVSILLVAGI